MEKNKSLDFLNNCLNEIKSLSQEEFDRIVIEKGLETEDANFMSIDMEFEILFNNPIQLNEEFDIPYTYNTNPDKFLGEMSVVLSNNIDDDVYSIAA